MVSLKIFTKNFKILLTIFLILLLFNVIILNYIVKSYSVDFQSVKNKSFHSKGGWGNDVGTFDDEVEEDELLQLNANFIRFSNMHEKLLIDDAGKLKKPQTSSKTTINKPINNNNNIENDSSSNSNNNNIKEIIEKEKDKVEEIIDEIIDDVEKVNDIAEANKQQERELKTEEKEGEEEIVEDEEEERGMEEIDYNNKYKYSQSIIKNTNSKLLIVIPTLPREIENDHLSSILNSFEEQSKDITALSGLDTKVLVFNNSPKNHPIFYRLKEHYRYKFRDIFTFKDNPNRIFETNASPLDDNYYLNRNETTYKMRQKNLDIVKMLRTVQEESDYIMIMEDDFPLCSSSISILPYLLKKSGLYNPNWDLIKTSIGLNGFIFKSKSINRITNYLEHNRKYKPIEALLSEWMCGQREIGEKRTGKCNESRRNSIIFRLTLFSHINGASTFKRDSNSIKFPHCWYDYTHLLPIGDRYYVKQCLNDDLAPCIQYTPTRSMITDLSEISHLNHYLKAKVVISPTTKRNITIEVSFIQRDLPPIYKSTSILEDLHNFSTTSAASLHKRNSNNNNNNNRKGGNHYYNDNEDDFFYEDNNNNRNDGFMSGFFYYFLIFIIVSVIFVLLFILYKRLIKTIKK